MGLSSFAKPLSKLSPVQEDEGECESDDKDTTRTMTTFEEPTVEIGEQATRQPVENKPTSGNDEENTVVFNAKPDKRKNFEHIPLDCSEDNCFSYRRGPGGDCHLPPTGIQIQQHTEW